MFDLLAVLRARGITPEMLAQMQQKTGRVRATITVERDGLSLKLAAPDPEAEAEVPKVVEGMVRSLQESLYILYGMSGEVYR